MKKLLRASLLALCPILFFSCATTGKAAKQADEPVQEPSYQSGTSEQMEADERTQTASSDSSAAQENFEQKEGAALADNADGAQTTPNDAGAETAADISEAAAPETLEEKIPQDELEADFTAQSPSASKIIKDNDGTLLEKIKDGQNKAKDTSVSVAAPLQDKKAEDASQKSAPASSDATELTRVTSQGSSVKGGPLVGPGSDKANLGRDGASAETAGAARTAASALPDARQSYVQEANEGIALAVPQTEEQEEAPQEEKPEPVASRSMTIRNNQFVDVTYPGSGWIYLGEEDGGDRFIFQGRKLGNGETTFSLRSKKPGTSLLHFYKNDILTGNYIDDWIEITVGEKSAADAVHVQAPSYAEVVPPKFDRAKNTQEKERAVAQAAAKKQAEREEKSSSAMEQTEGQTPAPAAQKQAAPAAQTEASPAEKVQTVIQTSGQEKSDSKQKTAVAGTSAPSRAPADKSKDKSAASSPASGADKAKNLLERAQKAYDEKRYEEALDLVQQFFDAATEDFDAGLYLEGLILEAKSSVRNIKSAIGAYDTLIKNWPQSQYWRRANERSIYLKRFYIDIR